MLGLNPIKRFLRYLVVRIQEYNGEAGEKLAQNLEWKMAENMEEMTK
jgi:hypothetical protein